MIDDQLKKVKELEYSKTKSNSEQEVEGKGQHNIYLERNEKVLFLKSKIHNLTNSYVSY